MPTPKDPVQTQRDKIANQIKRSAETRDRQIAGAKERAEAAHKARIAPLQTMLSALSDAKKGA